MKLAVFGGTGKTGRPLLEQALAAGHEVRALVRDPGKLPLSLSGHERLELIQGDALDPEAVARTVKGVDAVLSVLGQTKGSPPDLVTRATENILAAMHAHGVRRIVTLTGAGVPDPRDRPKLIDRVFTFLLKRLSGAVLEDGEQHAARLKASGLAWTVVRAPRLTNGPHTGSYRVGFVGKDSGVQVSRADVADFMLQEVASSRFVQQMPVVTS
ncbi:NAD(P)-dependent oxidoreductase [Truepera radiovictrix]|uniref:NmrA family protein n=1 Tax=Truepera radiovictrix (strain DSM 17093 / CIP 108686 / LMG 22925 / RQ-24) TaxID=649638 RepID=D7CS94_TRURR|nr:SDR family oxidoreductase [Truepera radiovictrix]ADI13626.1 NmrA family protein [Truepera radiovictrix DSM 17093]WMT57812.1 SDR family oxidoreductase [Truepera radiovictrix]